LGSRNKPPQGNLKKPHLTVISLLFHPLRFVMEARPHRI
jgi:hypothetical protein